MENSSKALLMSTGILLGVLLISLMVFVFYFLQDYSQTILERNTDNDIYGFNNKYLVYDQRDDLTAQDVYTIYNMVNNYNSQYEDENDDHRIKLTGIAINSTILQKSLDATSATKEPQKYSCRVKEYRDGFVHAIEIKEVIKK